MTLPVNPTPADRLRSLLVWAEEQHARKLAGLPSEWDQGSFASRYYNAEVIKIASQVECGTAYCIAGKAVADAGGEFVWEYTSPYATTPLVRMPGKDVDTLIEDEAAELLGLDAYVSSVLFSPVNDIEDIRKYIGVVLAGGTPTRDAARDGWDESWDDLDDTYDD